jgi:hypothetical protein
MRDVFKGLGFDDPHVTADGAVDIRVWVNVHPGGRSEGERELRRRLVHVTPAGAEPPPA